jgi:hypothetical protein
LIDDLNENISNVINSLIWIHPKKLAIQVGGENDFKYTSLIGNKNANALIQSDYLHIGLMYLSPGTTFPQHAREAKETFLILSGTPHLGATLQHLEKHEIGSIVSYDSAAPRVFMVIYKKKLLCHYIYQLHFNLENLQLLGSLMIQELLLF